MKKHLFFTLVLICLSYFSMAQSFHWPLTGDLNDVIASKNGTNYGVTFKTDDVRGDVAVFDGNSYATLPEFLDSLTEVTIAVWFRMDESNGWAMIYSFGFGHLFEPKHVIAVNPVMGDGTERFKILLGDGTDGGNWYDIPVETDVFKTATDTWYYSVVVIKPDTVAYYINDTQLYLAGDSPWDLEGITDTANYLGVSYWSDPLWEGALSDLRVYDYAMTESEVKALYQSTLPSTTAIKQNEVSVPVIYSANRRLFINMDEQANDEIVTVYNLTGRLVTVRSLEAIRDISFEPGLYIVNIRGGKTNFSAKVIIK